jgi:hypothetical protein
MKKAFPEGALFLFQVPWIQRTYLDFIIFFVY